MLWLLQFVVMTELMILSALLRFAVWLATTAMRVLWFVVRVIYGAISWAWWSGREAWQRRQLRKMTQDDAPPSRRRLRLVK